MSYERGSFQTDQWSANVAGGAGKGIDYAFAADQFHTVGQYQNDFYRNTAGLADLGWRISPKTELRGMFRGFDSTVGLPNEVGYGLYNFSEHQTDRDYTTGLSLTDMRGHNFFQKISGGYHWERDIDLNPNTYGPYPVAALVRDVTTPVPRIYLVVAAESGEPAGAGSDSRRRSRRDEK